MLNSYFEYNADQLPHYYLSHPHLPTQENGQEPGCKDVAKSLIALKGARR